MTPNLLRDGDCSEFCHQETNCLWKGCRGRTSSNFVRGGIRVDRKLHAWLRPLARIVSAFNTVPKEVFFRVLMALRDAHAGR